MRSLSPRRDAHCCSRAGSKVHPPGSKMNSEDALGERCPTIRQSNLHIISRTYEQTCYLRHIATVIPPNGIRVRSEALARTSGTSIIA